MTNTSEQTVSVVITADQVDSRRRNDLVPAALAELSVLPMDEGSRAFARTAGDEIQGLLTDSVAVIRAVELLSRAGEWRVGIGLGDVVPPLPEDVRAARGGCFIAAREALLAARTAPTGLAVRAQLRGVPVALREADAGHQLQTVLWLLRTVWSRRTAAGWEVAAAVAAGAQQQHVAADLDITPSAVSQRLTTAMYAQGEAGMILAAQLLETARQELAG